MGNRSRAVAPLKNEIFTMSTDWQEINVPQKDPFRFDIGL